MLLIEKVNFDRSVEGARMKMLKVDSAALMSSDGPSSPAAEVLDISAAHLVFGYLTQHCFAETAAAFLAQWMGPNNESLSQEETFAAKTLDYRRTLRVLLLDGKVAEAIAYIEEFFPHLLGGDMMDGEEDDGCLRFRLLCQQFVEMVRRGDSTAALEFTESTLAPMAQNRPRLLAHLQVFQFKVVHHPSNLFRKSLYYWHIQILPNHR
jgi:hypothetical protein